jgi:hypothetical protein
MVQKNSIEAIETHIETQVKATLGSLYAIRNDQGFYEAKVALLVAPTWYREPEPYLLGSEINKHDQTVTGAWIKFGDAAEVITAQWQPRIGDRVIVYTFGEFGFQNGRIFRFPTSHDSNAEMAEDMQVQGPFRTLSGGML